MGLIDSIRQVFADDEDQITASDILSKVREKYPHLAGIDDAKLSASLAKKYPDRFGYLKTYAPGAPVPPAFVPKSMRTDAFYKANPEEGTKEALRVIDVVKAKYPKYKDIDAQTMAAALESKYPDTFKGLSSRLTPWKSSGAGDPEPSMPAPFAVLPNMPTQSQVKLGEVPKVGQVVSSTDKNTQPIQKPNVRPMVISLDSSKISLPKGTPVQTFKNGNDAYLAAEKAGRPIIVEYPNRSGKTIRRILGTTTVETTPPNVEDSLVDAITKKASDIAGTLGKATPEIVGEAVVETLRNPPDILNLTPEQQIRTGKNMATAGISTVAGMAGAVPAMARFLGADGKVLDGFDKAVGKLNEIAGKIAPKDPTLGDKLTQGAVSMAAFWLPGMAAEGAIAQLPKLGVYAARIAKAAKIATPTVLEAATEQGGVYNDLVQKGMDKDEAAKRAFGAFWKNIILIGITNTAGFGPDVKSRLGKSLMAMPSEGFQEGGQNVIAKISKGEPVDWEEAAADAGIGAFLGFGGGSALGGSHGTAEADTVPRGPSGPDGAAPAVPETMSPEMRTYLDKVAEINRKAKEIPSSDFIKEEVFKVPTQKEANAAEEARFSVAPDTVQRLAHSIRNEAVGQYNLDRNAFNQWKDLIGPGLQPPKIISGQRDVMGEYNTLEVWMKKKDGRPLDVVAQDAVEMGLIKSPEDIFDALRSLKAPQNPSRNAVDYLDEALRIHDYESSIEPNGPADTGFDFQVEQPDFSAEKPTLNKEHYTANLAKARIAGMPLREAVAFARESSLSKGQKDAVEAFNRIITANKLTDETFVQFVDSIKVDNEAFKKGYGAEFQSDKYAIRGATFPIKNHAAVKALVQFANGAHAGTGYHEAFHVVSSNVLTEQEYAVLQKKFGTEENIAESFAKYEKLKTGKEKQTAIKAIFDKIAAFLERLRSYFSGHGWRTADDVFRGVSEGRTEKSNREAEGPKFQAEPTKKPVFYSQLERTIQEKMPNSAPVAMVKNLIDPAKGNVKAEEVEWSGIEEFLAGKEKVTKAELLDFLKQNEVQVKEVLKGDSADVSQESDIEKVQTKRTESGTKFYDVVFDDGRSIRILDVEVENMGDVRRRAVDARNRERVGGMTKFSQYQLPGGENYREFLLTLPSQKPTDYKSLLSQRGWSVKQLESGDYVVVDGSGEWVTSEKDSPETAARYALRVTLSADTGMDFKSSHFDEPNILAHVRMNDRTTADGKRVLFLEEVQSDWHQKGREKGYAEKKGLTELPKGTTVRKDTKTGEWFMDETIEFPAPDEKPVVSTYLNRGRIGTIEEQRSNSIAQAVDVLNNREFERVPNAPFKKTWHELALKRMLRYAVDNGYDGIAWTTGAQQVDRYPNELRKLVDQIEWKDGIINASKDGRAAFHARFGADGIVTESSASNAVGKHVNEVLGKSMAEKVLGSSNGTIEGKDFAIGGKGMEGFYDQMIPSFLNKYTKKWGGRVGEASVQVGKIVRIPDDFQGPLGKRDESLDEPKYETVHALDITPSMRESVAQGQPMFQAEKTSLIEDSVYEKNRKMQKSRSMTSEIGNALSSAKDQAETLFTPISSVLADIHPMLRVAFRRQAYREGLTRHEDTKAVLPFLEKAKSMRSEDRADLDLALKNGDAPKISALVSAYGLEAEYKAVRKTLNAIHARAKEVGYDVGYLEDYWPRVIKDQAGFLEAMKADKKWPDIEKLISMKQDELKRPLSEDEKVALINSYLRGYQNATIALARTPNMKTREVEVIGPDLNQHFRRFDDAVVRYISSMNHAIEARRFFGRGGKDLFVDELDQSIGHYVLDMKSKGLLKNARDEKRLRDILNAYFDQKSMHGALAAYKDATVTMTIGNAVAALTQLQDLGTSVYRAPGHAVQSLGRAMIGGSKITLEDLGLEQIAEELRDDRKSAVFVSKVLRAAGLAKLDKLTAETFINSVISKYQSQAKAKNPGSEFMDRIRNLVGPDTGKAIEDLKSGEVTDLVKFIAFSEILGVQPKAMTELPKAYLSGGNARIFYALKTFQLRQLDLFRQEIFKKLAEPGLKNKVIGTRRLVALTTSLLLAGIGTDELKDWLLGRKTTMSDRVAENRLKLAGLSKWTIYKARQEGIGSAVMKTVLPPAPLVDQLWKDIRTAGDNKGLEVVQSIPLVGKFYYWWLGRGTLKRPISDDAMYLKQNAGRLGLSRTGAYRAMNRAIDIYQTMPKGPKREAAKARAMEIASKLADRVRAKESQFAEIEMRRKKRAAELGLSR